MLFQTMIQRVPAAYDLSLTYAKIGSAYCPAPPSLSQSVLDRLGEGCLLFNYIGHGDERGPHGQGEERRGSAEAVHQESCRPRGANHVTS